MPPRKGIVKSGNAGNSSRGDSKPQESAKKVEWESKPLFPPGFKMPLSLLNERCLIFSLRSSSMSCQAFTSHRGRVICETTEEATVDPYLELTPVRRC